jgi:hypothetical protein
MGKKMQTPDFYSPLPGFRLFHRAGEEPRGPVEDGERSCMEARDLAQEHLRAIRAKLGELKALERTIAGFIATCDATCAGGPGSDCAILEDLARP